MSTGFSLPTRRGLLAASAAVSAFSLVLLATPTYAQTVPAADAKAPPENLSASAEYNAIRPFRINVPEEELVDLRRRIVATRWPGGGRSSLRKRHRTSRRE